MYANNLAFFSPSSAGSQQLLYICSDYRKKYNVHVAKRSIAMICRIKEDKGLHF